MKTKNIAITAAFITLGIAAAYPHIQAYRQSLPQTLTEREAGKRYLTIICPVNKVGGDLAEIEKKIDEESKKLYFEGSESFNNANTRMGALSNNQISVGHRLAAANETAARKLSDPKFIWPEKVKKDVELFSDELFVSAGEIKRILAGDEFEVTKKGPAGDRVRRLLNLPVRGVCPAEYLK